MMPLISVVMPVFNATDTLPLALASLQAQTYDDWQCIIVDDGSTDNPEHIINAVGDSRIQCRRLDRNHGRGHARQYALEMAQGKYIAFLDGDDWLYPDKFQDQVELLEAEPDVAMVSTGMAIANTNDQLVGVRYSNGSAPVLHPPMKHPGMPPLAFAPSMIRADLAKQTGFDTTFPIAEDADFLLRALLGNNSRFCPRLCMFIVNRVRPRSVKSVRLWTTVAGCSKNNLINIRWIARLRSSRPGENR